MKIYVIEKIDYLCESTYILPKAYKDKEKAESICEEFNKKAEKSKDVFERELAYKYICVEVEE